MIVPKHLPVNVNRIITARQMGWSEKEFVFICPFSKRSVDT